MAPVLNKNRFGLTRGNHLLRSKHLLQMPHTWGGSDAEPVAAVPPCLLPPFAAVVVLTALVDVAVLVSFSVLDCPAIVL